MQTHLTILLLLATFIVFIISKYLQKIRFWKRQNVSAASVLDIIKRTVYTHLYVAMHEVYQKMCEEQQPFKVIETLLLSVVVVKDQNALQDVLISQFEKFSDRGFYVNHRDPLLPNLARLEYDLWKPLRMKFAAALTPAKTKYMFPTFLKVGDQMGEVLRNSIAKGENVVEMYDFCNRIAIDFIANIGFGIDCNSLKDPDAEFRTQGNIAIRGHFRPYFDQFARKYSKYMNLLNVKYHSKKTIDFFTNIVKETVEYREKHELRRNDFMDIMIELKNDSESNAELSLTLELMVGQVFAFFAGGFDNSSSTMSYVFYELAHNQEIQEKARTEIQEVMAKYDNKITYESIREMTYTNKITLETLRKYPTAHCLPRTCRRPCNIRTASGSIEVPAHTTIIIPIYGIHHNPEFYPEPEEFRPERFDEEELAKRPPCTFLGFGDGPKTCVAERFSRIKLTFFFAVLLSQFRFSLCEKTPKKLLFDKRRMFTLSSRGDIYLNVETVESIRHDH